MARRLTIWRTNRIHRLKHSLFAISRSQYPSQFSSNYSHVETLKRFIEKDQMSNISRFLLCSVYSLLNPFTVCISIKIQTNWIKDNSYISILSLYNSFYILRIFCSFFTIHTIVQIY